MTREGGGVVLMSSADSVHRNIAEGYCRRSIHEYLNFLNFALGSLGETVSAFHAYRTAGQIDEQTFDALDSLAYRLENSLLSWSKASNESASAVIGSIP